MDVQYLTSYNNTGKSGQFNQVGGQTFNIFNGAVSQNFGNMYIETTARLARSYPGNANAGGPNDVWTWDDGPNHHLEIDVFELYEDQGGFGNAGTSHVHWYSYSTNNLPSGWAPTSYHKYGALLTSDGATARNVCMFVDDILQGCGVEDAANFDVRNRIIMSAGSNQGAAAENIDLLVQNIKVYSCSDWQTSMCNGATQFNGTQNGQSFVYWYP
jgi:hypothetical protein